MMVSLCIFVMYLGISVDILGSRISGSGSVLVLVLTSSVRFGFNSRFSARSLHVKKGSIRKIPEKIPNGGKS